MEPLLPLGGGAVEGDGTGGFPVSDDSAEAGRNLTGEEREEGREGRGNPGVRWGPTWAGHPGCLLVGALVMVGVQGRAGEGMGALGLWFDGGTTVATFRWPAGRRWGNERLQCPASLGLHVCTHAGERPCGV